MDTLDTLGKLDKEYVKDGLQVKVFSSDVPDLQRVKINTQIREKIVDVVSGIDCKVLSVV